MITLADSAQLTAADLPLYLREADGETALALPQHNMSIIPGARPADIKPWVKYEKKIIALALEKYGSFNAAGKVLGLTHKTVAAKAQKYGISKVISWDNGDALVKNINKNDMP